MIIEATLQDLPTSVVTTNGTRRTQTGALSISLTEPEGMDFTRAGRRFMLGNNAPVTGIAPVQALPTTAAQWTIFNNEAAGGKTYYFDTIGVELVSGTIGATGTKLICCVYTLPVNSGSSTAGTSVVNCSATSSNASRAIIKSAVTITTPAAPTWIAIAQAPHIGAGANDNVAAVNYEVRGRIAIGPQSGLGLAVQSATGTSPLFAPVAMWYEQVSTLG